MATLANVLGRRVQEFKQAPRQNHCASISSTASCGVRRQRTMERQLSPSDCLHTGAVHAWHVRRHSTAVSVMAPTVLEDASPCAPLLSTER